MNRMKALREEKQIPMKEAARRIGIPYTTYVNYEKGLREPNSEMLIQIADFYNCSIDYLLGKTNDRVDDRVLDAVNGIDPWLLSIVGNIADAQAIQALIDKGDTISARKRLAGICGDDVACVVNEMSMGISDTDPQVGELLGYTIQLNAQGKERLCRYAEDLVASGKYQKTKKGMD